MCWFNVWIKDTPSILVRMWRKNCGDLSIFKSYTDWNLVKTFDRFCFYVIRIRIIIVKVVWNLLNAVFEGIAPNRVKYMHSQSCHHSRCAQFSSSFFLTLENRKNVDSNHWQCERKNEKTKNTLLSVCGRKDGWRTKEVDRNEQEIFLTSLN